MRDFKSAAVLEFKTALLEDPQYIDAYYGLIQVLGKLDYMNEAKIVFENALEKKLDYPEDIYSTMGIVYAEKDLYDSAITMFRSSIGINSNYSAAYINLGIVFYKQGKYENAIEKFQKAAEIDPNNGLIYFNWGKSLAALNLHLAAMDMFIKTKIIDKNFNVIADIYWGISSGELRKCDDPTITDCSEARSIDSYR